MAFHARSRPARRPMPVAIAILLSALAGFAIRLG